MIVYDAFQFLCMSPYHDDEAYVNIVDGRVLCIPTLAFADQEEVAELEEGKWFALPNKEDLDPGKELALDFSYENFSPKDLYQVKSFFCQPGAYRWFKDLLNRRGLLQKWYFDSETEERQRLKEWLTDNGIEFVDNEPPVIVS